GRRVQLRSLSKKLVKKVRLFLRHAAAAAPLNRALCACALAAGGRGPAVRWLRCDAAAAQRRGAELAVAAAGSRDDHAVVLVRPSRAVRSVLVGSLCCHCCCNCCCCCCCCCCHRC
ncbi:MAG: hypothetical protein ACK4ZJ_18490, partial [Allorhizobium sp.]